MVDALKKPNAQKNKCFFQFSQAFFDFNFYIKNNGNYFLYGVRLFISGCLLFFEMVSHDLIFLF